MTQAEKEYVLMAVTTIGKHMCSSDVGCLNRDTQRPMWDAGVPCARSWQMLLCAAVEVARPASHRMATQHARGDNSMPVENNHKESLAINTAQREDIECRVSREIAGEKQTQKGRASVIFWLAGVSLHIVEISHEDF